MRYFILQKKLKRYVYGQAKKRIYGVGMRPVRFITSVVIAAAALGVTACAGAANYVSLDSALPGAQMTFHKSYEGLSLGVAALQGYALSADEYCDSAKGAGSFTWTSANEKTLRVTPDILTFVWAGTNYMQTANVSMINGNPVPALDQRLCRNVVSFTPQRDHAYDVRHLTTNGSLVCSLQIIDLTTGSAAPDVEFLQLGECVKRTGTAAS